MRKDSDFGRARKSAIATGLKIINVFTDGASRGNPGPSSIGIIFCDENKKVIKTYGKYLGTKTNNSAEYLAIIEAVSLLREMNDEFDEVKFFSDSELMVRQLNGVYKIKNEDLAELSEKFFSESKSLGKKFSLTHVPRSENKLADKLANEILDEQNKNA